MPSTSKISLVLCYLIVLVASFMYYPKWIQPHTEATISWDVSGYYWYLPAIFIYEDLVEQKWKNDIHSKYHPDAGQDQSYEYRPGVMVNKYSCGMAVQYLPSFVVAHMYAKATDYPADGFSRPYQLSLQIWSVLFCILGLLLMRKVLLLYFDDGVAAVALLLLILGTNYLNSGAIDSALTHNYLFTWYALLILLSHRFYRLPSTSGAIFIGLVLGILALSRPTEAVAAIIPIGYGMALTSKESWGARLSLIRSHFGKYLMAIVAMVSVGALQLLYWRFATGEWIVYSYGDQGFSFLRPHFLYYNFSYASGWLTYSPLLIFFLGGIFWLGYRRPRMQIFSAFALVFWYVTCAWDFWNYGGRAMVQSYPVLMLGLAFVVERVRGAKVWKAIFYSFVGLFIVYNIWWTHGIHKGGYTSAYDNTKGYFWRTLLRTDFPPEVQKLKDTKYIFEGLLENKTQLAISDFSDKKDSLYTDWQFGDGGYDFVNAQKQYSAKVEYKLTDYTHEWYRVSAHIRTRQKEWGTWTQSRLILQGFHDDEPVAYYSIRLDRLSPGAQDRVQWLDVPVRDLKRKGVNRLIGMVQHNGSPHPTLVDDLMLEAFDEK